MLCALVSFKKEDILSAQQTDKRKNCILRYKPIRKWFYSFKCILLGLYNIHDSNSKNYNPVINHPFSYC
jgi:hypothetical protein